MHNKIFFSTLIATTLNLHASNPQTKSDAESNKFKTTSASAVGQSSAASCHVPQVPNAPINKELTVIELTQKARSLTIDNDNLRVQLLFAQERLERAELQRQHYLVWATRALTIVLEENKAHLLKEFYSASTAPEDIPEWTSELLEAQLKKLNQERKKNGDKRYSHPADYCEEDDTNENE